MSAFALLRFHECCYLNTNMLLVRSNAVTRIWNPDALKRYYEHFFYHSNTNLATAAITALASTGLDRCI